MGLVLLIEGHRLMRSAIVSLLAQNGREVVEEAVDPIEGVQKIIWHPPNVIVLDTTWHDVNGFWLSRLLRALAPQSRIILLVDDGTSNDLEAARSSGADACIDKTLLTQELPRVLARWKQSEDSDGFASWSLA